VWCVYVVWGLWCVECVCFVCGMYVWCMVCVHGVYVVCSVCVGCLVCMCVWYVVCMCMVSGVCVCACMHAAMLGGLLSCGASFLLLPSAVRSPLPVPVLLAGISETNAQSGPFPVNS
jgi:hypothetical protein